MAVKFDLRIVGPFLSAAFRVECDHPAERRGEIHRAIDDDWRVLERAPVFGAAPVRDVAGVIDPGDFELRDVTAIDLVERRVTHPARIVAVIGPFSYRAAFGRG